MAEWRIFQKGEGKFGMIYVDLFTGRQTVCGEAEAPVSMLIDWIIEHGDPDLGDFITVNNRILQISRKRASA